MSQENARLSRLKFVSLFIAFAPLMTMLYFAMRDFERAMGETVDESPPSRDRDWHLIAFLTGGNLIWGVLMLCLIWILTKVPYQQVADRLLTFWAAVDPNIVWEPWQAVVLVAAAGVVLFAIGLRGVVGELSNTDRGQALTPPGPVHLGIIGAAIGAYVGYQSGLLMAAAGAAIGFLSGFLVLFTVAFLTAITVYAAGGTVRLNGNKYSRKTNNEEA